MQTAWTPPKTGYWLWMEQEGIPIIEAYGIEDLNDLPRKPWARMGGSGAYIELKGQEGVTGMYVVEIPSGGALNPERHLYEELIYIVKGRGLTEVWHEEGRKQTFEWGEGSLFAPPLNTWHRLVNGGREPALALAVSTAPIMLDIYRDPSFVFNTSYQFKSRFGGEEGYFNVGDKRYRVGPGAQWETNFIPDVRTAALDEAEHKVSGGLITSFEMGGNTLVGHIADWPAGRYHKAHYHGSGAILLILRSKGYLLMWPKEVGTRPYQAGREDAVVEFHWKPGSLYSPPNGWFHMHINTGAGPARQLALRPGSRNNPLTLFDAAHRKENGVLLSIQEGGTMIEYEYEDPEIRRRYEEALKREGVKCEMPPVVYKS
ncbi:MAG TPA: cupin domain-containing protein [Dehalococcoidia bacterium]|nr:cupin domain-containing protein [Dehalococcoidia bacterium]